MKLSDCCGSAPRNYNNDCDSMDFGVCPRCGDHCEYVEDDEELLTREFTPDQQATINQMIDEAGNEPTC